MTTSSIYQTINPATGEVLNEYPTIGDGEVDTVVQQSVDAFNEWRKLTVEQRAAKVERLAQLFEDNVDELAAIMTKEMGKPLAEARSEEHTSELQSRGQLVCRL